MDQSIKNNSIYDYVYRTCQELNIDIPSLFYDDGMVDYLGKEIAAFNPAYGNVLFIATKLPAEPEKWQKSMRNELIEKRDFELASIRKKIYIGGFNYER